MDLALEHQADLEDDMRILPSRDHCQAVCGPQDRFFGIVKTTAWFQTDEEDKEVLPLWGNCLGEKSCGYGNGEDVEQEKLDDQTYILVSIEHDYVLRTKIHSTKHMTQPGLSGVEEWLVVELREVRCRARAPSIASQK
jgi:hypothetical protein